MILLRHLLGDALRRLRLRQGRTLREVSAAARVSLGYLSEVERGQKEASSELLASICGALGAPLSQVLREVSDNFALAELQNEPVFTGPVESALGEPARSGRAAASVGAQPVGPAASHRAMVPAGVGVPPSPERRVVVSGPTQRVATGERLAEDPGLVQLPTPCEFDRPAHLSGHDITDMVPV
jgi:transcriptional regulator with XRE-family HTH domain